jgi:hypothetical protein
MATENTSLRRFHSTHTWRSRGLRIALILLVVVGTSGYILTSSGCARRQTQSTSEKVTYTCPMHPEVKSDKPGKCPKCGMNLVPAEKPANTQQG